MWQALESLYEEGRVKSIGVSNFGVGHIEELKGLAKVWPPHVNQIEVSDLFVSRRHSSSCYHSSVFESAVRYHLRHVLFFL